jgi:hypothetical protein
MRMKIRKHFVAFVDGGMACEEAGTTVRNFKHTD